MGNRRLLIIIFIIMILNINCFVSYGDEIEYENTDMNLEEYFIDRDLDGEQETRIEVNRNTKEIGVGESIIGYTGYLYKILYEDLTNDGSLEMILVMKDEGTSSALSYRVYDMKDSEDISLVLEKNDIYKGILEIEEGKILEKIPLYLEGDSNVMPSEYKINEYIYNCEEEKFEIVLERNKGIEELYSDEPEKEYQIYYENPNRDEIEALIEEVADEKAIPPVILKAIAYTESNMTQFRDGKPLVSFDGVSYGIMQVTPSIHTEYDLNKLKYDIRYNIEAGAEILLGKWGLAFRDNPLIPQIGNGDPRVLENWYFAVWAYNGWAQSNNPNMIPYEHATWVQTKAYQDKVFGYAQSEFGQVITKIDKKELPEIGLPNKYEIFETPDPSHSHQFNIYGYGDIITNMTKYGLTLRDDEWGRIEALSPRIGMIVINGPRLYNGYIRYKVQPIKEDEEVNTGWVAMNWIKSIKNSDVNNDGIINLEDSDEIRDHMYDGDDDSLEAYDLNYDDYIDSYDAFLAEKKYELLSAYKDYKALSRETGVSNEKDWIVRFNRRLKSETVNNRNIYVLNRENGEKIESHIELLNDNETVKIHHPYGGYISGNIYLIVIKQDVKAYDNGALKQPVIMEFTVE